MSPVYEEEWVLKETKHCVKSTCIYKFSSNRSENFNRAAVLSLQIEECRKINYWCQPEELVSSSCIQTLGLEPCSCQRKTKGLLSLIMLFLIQANALKNQISCSRNLTSLFPDSLSPFQSHLGKCKFLIFNELFQFHLLIIFIPHSWRTQKGAGDFILEFKLTNLKLISWKANYFLEGQSGNCQNPFSCNSKAHYWYLHSWNLKATTSSELFGLSFITWDFRIPESNCN